MTAHARAPASECRPQRACEEPRRRSFVGCSSSTGSRAPAGPVLDEHPARLPIRASPTPPRCVAGHMLTRLGGLVPCHGEKARNLIGRASLRASRHPDKARTEPRPHAMKSRPQRASSNCGAERVSSRPADRSIRSSRTAWRRNPIAVPARRPRDRDQRSHPSRATCLGLAGGLAATMSKALSWRLRAAPVGLPSGRPKMALTHRRHPRRRRGPPVSARRDRGRCAPRAHRRMGPGRDGGRAAAARRARLSECTALFRIPKSPTSRRPILSFYLPFLKDPPRFFWRLSSQVIAMLRDMVKRMIP
jgi:hypothetical protein